MFYVDKQGRTRYMGGSGQKQATAQVKVVETAPTRKKAGFFFKDELGRTRFAGGPSGGGGGTSSGGVVRSFSSDSPEDAINGANILSNEQAQWEKTLTRLEHEAIDSYTDTNVGGEINMYVRTGSTFEIPEDEIAPLADALSAALSRNDIAKNTVTYRGVGEKFYKKIENMPIGATDTFKEFASVSLAQRYADWFRAGNANSLRVIVAKGTHGAYISRLGEYAGEFEVLLDKGTKYKVIGEQDGVLTVETIP